MLCYFISLATFDSFIYETDGSSEVFCWWDAQFESSLMVLWGTSTAAELAWNGGEGESLAVTMHTN